MIEEVIADDNVYESSHCPIYTKVKELDLMKLRRLLSDLGFNPTSIGTQYIIEELKFFYENNYSGINKLKEAYSISAELHNVEISKVQWDIESAIAVMNKYANKDLIKSIFYWYDNYNNISPRFFMSTMVEYLWENADIYNKNS